MKILPRKEFEEAFIESDLKEGVSLEAAEKRAKKTAGFYSYDKEVILPSGSSTSAKLHELGHEAYGHGYMSSSTIEDVIFREIEAEIYSFENRGKDTDYRVGIEAMKQLIHDYGYSPKEAVYWVSLYLVKDFDIPVSKENKKELLELAKKVDR